MSINHTVIKKLLKSKKYTQCEIADIVGCSTSTVVRDAKKFNLQYGRGVKHHWQFQGENPSLTYLLGIIITDGSIIRNYESQAATSVYVCSTTMQIITQAKACFSNIGLEDSISQKTRKYAGDNGHKGERDIHTIYSYSSLFAKWIEDVTKNKQEVPEFMFHSSKECQLAFLSGVIDGDGSVSKGGSIRIRATGEWIRQLEIILESLNIRTGGYGVVKILDSGKAYGRISVHRSDYRSLGGACYHPIKKSRIMHGKDNRERKNQKRTKYMCRECGKKKMTNKGAKSCRDCYLGSKRHIDHCRNISKKGNRAANIARWGTGHLK